MKRKTTLTRTQIKGHIKTIQDAIDKQKRKRVHKGMRFAAITPEEIERKLKRVNSPIIVSQGSNENIPSGTTLTYFIGVHNPDPITVDHLFAHVWVGSGKFDPPVATFLQNVDTRFPRLTQPEFWLGLSLAPGETQELNFDVAVPAGIEKSSYVLQTCLVRAPLFDIPEYPDRATWIFQAY